MRQLKVNANNLLGKAAIRRMKIENKVRTTLQNPNKALANALKGQLEPRGVKLGGMGAAFVNGDKLFIKLVGGAA